MNRKIVGQGKRAPNGASSIYQDKNGKWRGRVTMGVRDDGKTDRRHVESWDRKTVTDKARKLERARDEGNATKHVIKHVGAHKLPNLLPDHLERMYRKMQDSGSSAGTAHQVHRTVRTALNEAVVRGYLAKNPALLAEPPRVEEDEIEPLNRDEITKIFAVALEGRNACRWVVAIALGLRQGEVLGLRWQDVDFHEGTLTVAVQRPRPKWQHGCEGACGHKHAGHCPQRVNKRKETARPKSKAGRRTIGLPQPLLDQLRLHVIEQGKEREEAAELWDEQGWLFTNEVGNPLNHRTDLAHWKQLLKTAGVRDARLHDARHTAATVLQMSGVASDATLDKIRERPLPATSPFGLIMISIDERAVTTSDQAIVLAVAIDDTMLHQILLHHMPNRCI